MRNFLVFLSVLFVTLGIFSDKLPVVEEEADFTQYSEVLNQGTDTPYAVSTYRIRGMHTSYLTIEEAVTEARKMFFYFGLVCFVILMTILKNSRRV